MIDEQAEAIVQSIAARHFVSVERLRGPEKGQWVYAARQAAARALDKQGLTSAEIGRLLNRHQTTILNMLGKIGNRGGTTHRKRKQTND